MDLINVLCRKSIDVLNSLSLLHKSHLGEVLYRAHELPSSKHQHGVTLLHAFRFSTSAVRLRKILHKSQFQVVILGMLINHLESTKCSLRRLVPYFSCFRTQLY